MHNIVEPLAWGIPTVCGSDLKKQPEAPYYAAQGALTPVENAQEFRDYLMHFIQSDSASSGLIEKAKAAKAILESQRGAAKRLAQVIRDLG